MDEASLGTRPYMRIWVWCRPIEGFVPEECNNPAVHRLMSNVILFIAAYCGRLCIRLRLRVGILQSQWSLGRSVVDQINTVVQKNTSISLRLLVAIQRCRFQLLCSVLRRDALF